MKLNRIEYTDGKQKRNKRELKLKSLRNYDKRHDTKST